MVSDSISSKWTQRSAASNSTGAGASIDDTETTVKPEYLIQTLGPSSFVTRTTEVTFSTRDPEIDVDHVISEVHISVDRSKATTPHLTDFIPDLPVKA